MADNSTWRASVVKYGVCIYNFNGDSKLQLSLEIGTCVHILEEYGQTVQGQFQASWYRGYAMQDKKKLGIFPASYIHQKPCKVENIGRKYETVVPVEDPIIKEVTLVLREWLSLWKDKYVYKESCALFERIGKVMKEVIRDRTLLVHNTITEDQLKDVKDQIVTNIDWGNGQLQMDLIPRVNGEKVDAEDHSAVDLYRLNCSSVFNNKGSLPRKSMKRNRTSKDNAVNNIHHLLVNVTGFPCNVGDEAEIYLSLYRDNRFISEKLLARFKQGMPSSIEKLDKYYGLFLDLSDEDISKDLFVVAQIYRYGAVLQLSSEQVAKGKMLLDNSSKKAPLYKYRRPWGGAVFNLNEVEQNSMDEIEYQFKVQSCVDADSNITHLHENLIKKCKTSNDPKAINTEKANFGMAVSLRWLHGDIATVKGENPMLFSKDIAMVQKLGFSDVVNPGEVRNDLYLTINSGEFERGSKKSAKNVEVNVSVYDSSGILIENCLEEGVGEGQMSVYKSHVFYHNNSPKWNSVVRVVIPIEKFNGAHIKLEYFHCSTRDKNEKKMLGFSFLQVTSQDASTLKDGDHLLCIYKCEDPKKVQKYTKLPMLLKDCAKEYQAALPYPCNTKESCTVSTWLCSSKFTQNTDLLNILQWTLNRDKITENLQKLANIPSQEIVKYLQDIVDALFSMFGAKNGERVPYYSEVFHGLVYIFNILQDKNFEKFQYVLEKYLEENFCHSLVYRDLMYCLDEKVTMAAQFKDKNLFIPVEKVFDVLEPIFKFTAKSCTLFQRAYGSDSVNPQVFKDIFQTFSKILASKDERLKEPQVRLLKEVDKIYQPLFDVISRLDLTLLIQELFNSVARDNTEVVIAKTKLIRQTINCPLFDDDESRVILLPICLSHIKKCLIQKTATEFIANTLADLLDRLFCLKKEKKGLNEIRQLVVALFDVIIDTLIQYKKYEEDKVPGLLVSCLIEMLRIMNESHYEALLTSYPHGLPLKSFLMRIFDVFLRIIQENVFPSRWTMMIMISNHAILMAIQYLAQSLTDCFLSKGNFDKEVWRKYLDLSVAFITQPDLQLETFSESKRQHIKEKYEDMRVVIGFLLQNLWNSLGENKIHFIPEMIGPFLKVTFVREKELRKTTIPIFFDMMFCEQKQKGNFDMVKKEMIDRLDSLITSKSKLCDQEYKELFERILLEKVQSEPSFQEEGKKFVFSVTDLLDRLLDYREVLNGEENRDKRMHCTFNILNFYKDSVNREEMYIRYIKKLSDLHYTANNFVEAGLTLQLYAQQILGWRNDILPAECGYNRQKESERKENLYLLIIECFDKGKAWEYGIPLCKELAHYYETKIFDYKRLSAILKKQATFFDHILEDHAMRQDPCYFRVAYYGTSFPPFVRNKAFVYRGDECLKLSTIMSQLITEFPNATILSSNNPPDDSVKQGEAQFIQICNVKPIADIRHEFRGKDIPEEITNFYSVNEIDTFQFDLPYHNDEKDPNNEFKSLCLERTMLKTSYKLPGILRWYEVIDASVVHLSPVEAAIDSLQNAMSGLEKLINRCRENPDVHLRELTMRLQGIISAAVSGGIPKYQEAFFNKEYLEKHPEMAGHLDELKEALLQKVEILGEGLKLHGRYASSEILPLHKNLTDLYENIKRGVTETGSPQVGRMTQRHLLSSSSRPSTPSTTSLHSSSSNRSSVISGDNVSQDEENVYSEPAEVSSSSGPFMNKLSSSQTLLSPTYASKSGSTQSVPEIGQSSSPEHSTNRRFTTSWESSAPPLPRRKKSEGRTLQHSMSVAINVDKDAPRLPDKVKRKSNSFNIGQKSPIEERKPVLSTNGASGGDHPAIPPRTPSATSRRPSIPPLPTKSPADEKKSSATEEKCEPVPPPIPKRTSLSIPVRQLSARTLSESEKDTRL